MNDNLYEKLADMYAGRELSEELEADLRKAAESNPKLRYQMESLRNTVDTLRENRDVDFTEESYQRVLMKIYMRGVDIQPKAPSPAHLQYNLPIQG